MELRRRFVAETGLAALAGALALLTAVVPDWIEAVFGVDPDGGNGTLEWVVVGVLAVVAVVAALVARHDHLRLQSA